jgi:hypothetical protein
VARRSDQREAQVAYEDGQEPAEPDTADRLPGLAARRGVTVLETVSRPL